MKNEKLDELTRLAAEVKLAIPDMLLGGDGFLRYKNGKTVDRFALIQILHRALTDADALHRALESEPRRKVKEKT